MDIGTHALASLALSRAIFPRAPRLLWALTIPAGVIADVDAFSALIGPSAVSQLVPHLHAFFIGVTDHRVYFRRGDIKCGHHANYFRACPLGAVFVAALLVAMAASRDGCGAMAGCGIVLAVQRRADCGGLAAND